MASSPALIMYVSLDPSIAHAQLVFLPQIRPHLHGYDLQRPSLWDHDHTDLLVLYNLQTVSLSSKLCDD